MKPNQTLLLLLSFSPVLILFAAAVDLGDFDAREIDVPICKRTDYPDLCVYAAHTYGHRYPTIDPMSLLNMHVDMATDHTHSALAVARLSISKDPHPNHRERGAFSVCISQLRDALDDLGNGLNAVRHGDRGTANSMLSGAITDYTTCDDAFVEIPASNPMAKRDRFLAKMVSNALVFAQLVLSSD